MTQSSPQSNPTRTKSAGERLSAPAGDTQTIALGYGEEQIPFRFDPEQFKVVAPNDGEKHGLSDVEIRNLLDAPVGTPPLEEIVSADEQVVIVVPDATRVAGVERIAPLLVERLNARGLDDRQISVLIGGGIHRAPTPDEIRSILGHQLPERIAVYSHDANDAATHIRLGTTSNGTPVELNRRLVQADHVIVVGAISFHYIAGFSGGRKAILPGCAAERSIQANHLLSFDRETLEKRPGIVSGCLEGNVVHRDMEEAVAMLNPSFLVNTVLNSDDQIAAVYAGQWREAHRRGCVEYGVSHTVAVNERRPLVIVSVGGAPRDINLIQSHKAMEHAAGLLEEGGTMIVLAKCPGGLGRADFLRWFVPGGSSATARLLVEDYKINGQTAWGLRRKSERFRLLLVSTLEADTVRRMGLEPQASLDSALAAIQPQSGYIIPRGLTTLPQIRPEAVTLATGS
ncbi:MAG TPA: nickel-dependent lactate racemase [Pyrinomonadaceae bacterium]|nr:nickel-dependent lactate racemase [Pyrinomonadaceae bacterium]